MCFLRMCFSINSLTTKFVACYVCYEYRRGIIVVIIYRVWYYRSQGPNTKLKAGTSDEAASFHPPVLCGQSYPRLLPHCSVELLLL